MREEGQARPRHDPDANPDRLTPVTVSRYYPRTVPFCANCGHENRGRARFCEECGFPLAAGAAQAREQRKTVTVLFCDLTGSTALGETLDPERLRALLARYFERMKGIAERYGGSVEKYIGDAVMAVFGVPVVHEDDALRAVRAAVDMRDALPELGLEGRIGVMTGEVVTGAEDWLAGDAVNVAARLEQAAQPGEVLLGEPTLVLVRDTVEVEPVEPLELKGKSAPVPAYRLLRVLDATERQHETRFVGRERELGIVQSAWERACAGQRCELVTLLGDAGIGKSRLAAEALASIDANVVSGRCLPYGEGITYSPVVEVLKQLDVRPSDEAAAAALRSLLGETDAATSADEIAWAFRKTLEQVATRQPLVVVVDDLHWGEETFLDLIEHVALLSSSAPIVLVCLARPELLDRRPDWPVTLRIGPLDDEAVAELIPRRVPGELRERIARAAGGNPLFVEEMLAMAAEAEGEVVVPPTLQTLLAARLDQLEAAERTVLERGAVEGETFHRGAVQALAPEDAQVTPRLAALVRKELIRPTEPQLPGEDGFRFRHLLIRDAAYDSLPKAARAQLHERFAGWLEEHGVGLVELDEILGYHLEQACLYRAELGAPENVALAAVARRRLAAAGGRARARSDEFAAVNLLERAAALVPPTEIDIALENDLVFALLRTGEAGQALARATSIAERSSLAGDHVGELCGRLLEGRLTYYLEPQGATERLDLLLERALPVFEAARDDVALYIGYSALGAVAAMRAHMDAWRDADEQAFIHAQRAGLTHHRQLGRVSARVFGTTPVTELLAWLDEQEAGGVPARYLRQHRALALAMLSRFDEARALLAGVRADLADRGRGYALGMAIGQEEVLVELLAGDFATAAELGTEACNMLDELGERTILSTAAGRLAQALYALDRLDEADDWAGRASELGASDDGMTQMLWRQVRAKVLARRGGDDAGPLAREAVAIGEGTDMLNYQADAHADLGEVLLLTGKPDEAVAAIEQAVERYERKGNLASSRRAHARLAEIHAEAAAAQT
jgi:class 3 adenylate cyclase/tetratricopeptide (TPR) repeat protein